MYANYENKSCGVVVILSDGSEMSGLLQCGLSGQLEATLNNEKPFIQIEDENGNLSFISKTNVATIKPVNEAIQSTKPLKASRPGSVIWFETLGVSPNATLEVVKLAYHTKAKAYHPDLFSNDMPLEIRQYASEMLKSLNVAYEKYKASARIAA